MLWLKEVEQFNLTSHNTLVELFMRGTKLWVVDCEPNIMPTCEIYFTNHEP
jgi:hypothetical protein